MIRLELPVTIRTPRLDEVPNDADIVNAINDAGIANIVEGYILKTDIPEDSPFHFFAEININNSRLWEVIIELLKILPKKISFIYGHIDNTPTFSNYSDKDYILSCISPLEKELTQDGFLEYGFIYHDNEVLCEIFIKKAKYVQFWGSSLESFTGVMKRCSLYEIEDLNFIDEYPMVTESLSHFLPESPDTSEIISQFDNVFKK